MKMKLCGYLGRWGHNGLQKMVNWFLSARKHRLTQHYMFANFADSMAGGTAATSLIKFFFR
jgi:pterin-4a-carbinolamine dehydratase